MPEFLPAGDIGDRFPRRAAFDERVVTLGEAVGLRFAS
jgi:hypothetical protein